MRLHEEIADMAQALGFNAPIPLQISTVASKFPFVSERNQPFRAYSGIGQGNVAATPLQMAIIAATIANRGEVVHPRMEREPQFYPTGMRTSQRQDRAMSVETATMLTRMMVAAVDHGTGIKARIPGVRVAGKTGTAQSAPGADPHVWFVAFAPATNPKLAVCVFVRNGGEYGSEATGGIVAAPMAKRILEADRDIRGW
jgi:peptidoglycan glycosyltransferase